MISVQKFALQLLYAAGALLIFASPSDAALLERADRWALGLEGGVYKLTGGARGYSTIDQFGSLQVSRGLSSVWTLQLALRYGYVRPGAGLTDDGDTGWATTSGAPLYTPKLQPMVSLQRRFGLYSPVQPFVGAGVGLTSWKVVDKTGQNVGWFPSGDAAHGYDDDGNPVDLQGTNFTLGLEVGVDVLLGNQLALVGGGRFHYMPGNCKDNIGMSSLWGAEYVDANRSSAEAFLGLTWWFVDGESQQADAAVTGTAAPAGPGGLSETDRSDRWALGLEGGIYKLTGGDRDYSTLDQFGAIQISRGMSTYWTLQLALRYGYVRPGVGMADDGDVGWSPSSGAPLYTPMVQPMMRLQRRFALDSLVQPFVGVGAGLTSWKVVDKTGQNVGWFPEGDPAPGYDKDGKPVALEGTDFTLGIELGTDLLLNDHFVLNAGGRFNFMPGNRKDNIGMSALWGPEHVDANRSSAELFLGLTWWFGSSDKDDDRIVNFRDGCPDVAEDIDGFQDADGCPDPDNDDDGILDVWDDCPYAAEDVDGFHDRDGCPDPDNDLDGIADLRDACPEAAEDFDGFEDDDGCPDPDNDGDGVPDAKDLCPDTTFGSQVDAEGCVLIVSQPDPEPTPNLVVPFTIPPPGEIVVLEGVSFESGSAYLTAVSLPVIEGLARALKARPEVRVDLWGHTDSLGDPEKNLELSARRATKVRDALVRLGVASAQLRAIGAGDREPRAPNSTAAGRAINRRVELRRKK